MTRKPRLTLLVTLLLGLTVLSACGITRRGQEQVARIERELSDLDKPSDDERDKTGSVTQVPDSESARPGLGTDAAVPAGSAVTEPGTRGERAVAAVSGKGQYIYRMENTGTPAQIVETAKSHGLRHLIIRAGNPVDGFYVRDTLEQLLPLAHAAGIKVVAYDGPAMEDIAGDVARATAIATYTTSSGDRIDALGLDIERNRALNLSGPLAAEYGSALRAALPDVPLIGIVMNANYHLNSYPFAEIAAFVDVLSPMNYWSGVTKDSAAFMRRSMELLAQFGLPVSIIGQAYPIEGDRTYPTTEQFEAQMRASKEAGAVGISFWAWEYTRDDSWNVIKSFDW